MRHAHRFRRDGSNFLGIHRHGSPPSSASPDALALVLLSVLPILSCFSRLYFCCHSPTESCVGSLRLVGRRAPPLAQPKLRGKCCPSFARCCARSCAACNRASALSQRMTAWAHEGMRWSASKVAARNAEYRSLWIGPMPHLQ